MSSIKKLFLLYHGRFPGEKAASLFAAKSAEAFAIKGFDVTIVVPQRRGVAAQDAFDYFGVKKNFKIVELSMFDAFGFLPKKAAFWVNFFSFSRACRKYISVNAGPDDIIYSNESLPLCAASEVSRNIFYEMHDFPESKLRFFGKFLARTRWILVHNKWKVAKLYETFDVPENKVLYEPNAVNIDEFDQHISANDARKKLSLPLDRKIAIYTGSLFSWKGVDTLAQAADMIDGDFLAVFVGGTDRDIASFKSKYGSSKHILIAGHKKHAEIPLWQKAADILVLPNSGKESISLYYTSPMKLFEYMASKKLIVASDIPSIREILNDKNSVLVPPDNPLALAGAIKALMHDPKRGEIIATQAFRDVSDHTWEKRAERIISFIK